MTDLRSEPRRVLHGVLGCVLGCVVRSVVRSVVHCVLLASSLLPGATLAQSPAPANWPTRPVTIIIPGGPSSNTELEPRLYATKMTESLGRPFVIDFKPGGGNMIATQYVAKSPADGHTLLIVNATYPLMPLMFKDAPFDPIRSLAPIAQMSKRSTLFVMSNTAPFNNVKEYIAYGKANPGKINFATIGLGTTQHLHAVWLHSLMGVETAYVSYKTLSVLLPDMVAGRVDVGIASFAAAGGQVKAGKLRIFAYGAKERSPAAPDIPTIAEQGVPEFEYLSWLGVVAPAATPVPVINRINAELVKAARLPDVVERLASESNTVVASTPQEFQRKINSEVERWQALVKKTGFKFEE